MEETKEPPSSMGGETEKALHYEDWKSLPSDFEKDEETSQENEKESLETIEYHSETHSTVDMDQRHLLMVTWTMKEYLLMDAHNSMLVT